MLFRSVAEAIDFCEYYALEAERLGEPRRVDVPGEENVSGYLPRGVAVVIAPWNFPLAILTGMTSAALVAGNTVVMKPAEQSSLIGFALHEILLAAGVPPGALAFLPGRGEEVGPELVTHPDTALVAFTGSRAVGLAINRQAAEASAAGGRLVKRVIAELGGKNAIVIDDDADLDEAVLAVVQSAFGFQGQKCSACSRVIVLEGAHDVFLHRLVEATRALVVGDPMQPGTDVGPVIDEEAASKVRRYVEIGASEGKLELQLEVPAGLAAKVGKPYVGPAIVSGVKPGARVANDEIFGPVLAVIKARDLDEALAIANSTAYKLTGGIFSRKPASLERAKREFRVGNLYVNRGITGALVGRQPFGGFGMSGVGSKAGGRDYLLQFVEPRACCENTMRRGFAPGL